MDTIFLTKLLVIYLIGVNLYGFFMFFWDKQLAKHEKRRVPEATLFTIAASGGALGCFAAMYTFRHKTLHTSFVIGVPLLFLFNLVCIYFIYKYAA